VGVRRLALGRRDWEKMRDWVLERMPRRRPVPAAEVASPVGRLFEAKSRVEERRPVVGVDAAEDLPPSPIEHIPAPPSRPPVESAEPPSAAGGGTLAGRLLKKKQERKEHDEL